MSSKLNTNRLLGCWLTLVLLAWVGSAAAQVLPLDSVLRRVQAHNPALQQYKYQAKAKEAAVAGARSWEAPRVGAGYWMTPYNQRLVREMNNGQNGGQRMLSVEQMIPNPAKQRARRDYLAGQAAVVQADEQARFVQLRAEAKTRYYERAVLERKVQVLRQNEELLRFLVKLAEVRYPYNQSTLPSIYDAKARLELLLNEQRQVRGQIQQATVALNTLMNRPPAEDFAVDTTLAAGRWAALPADTAALAARSDVRSLNSSLAVLRLSRDLETRRRAPDFGVRFDHMSSIGTMPNEFTLMGMISLPLAPWAAREYKANVAALGYEAQALQKRREEILNGAAGRLAGLRIDLDQRQDQLTAFEKRILPALRRSYQATLLAYEQNTGQLFQVLEAWSTLKTTRLQYLDALQQQLTQQTAYEKELEQ